MQKTLLWATVAAASIGAAAAAKAGIPIGYEESSEFVMELPPGGEDILGPDTSLCHRVREYYVAFIPVLYWSHGYVLSTSRCNSGQYISLTHDQFSALQIAGVLPQNLPSKPRLSLAQSLPLPIWVSVIGWFVVGFRRANQRQRARFNQMGDLPEATKRVLDALCHAAQATNRTGATDQALIGTMAGNLTNVPVPAEAVDRALAVCLPKPKGIDLSRFGKGFSMTQRLTLLRAVILFLSQPTGVMSPAAKKFVANMAARCGLKRRQVASLYRELAVTA